MSRNQIGTWIDKLLFFILWSWYYLGVLNIAWAILPADSSLAIDAFTQSDLTSLVWSAACGFLLTLIGVTNATLNLKAARKSGDIKFIVKNSIDVLMCAVIALLPLIAISHRMFIQETFNPHVWLGLVCLSLFATAFHYRRAQKTRQRLLGAR